MLKLMKSRLCWIKSDQLHSAVSKKIENCFLKTLPITASLSCHSSSLKFRNVKLLYSQCCRHVSSITVNKSHCNHLSLCHDPVSQASVIPSTPSSPTCMHNFCLLQSQAVYSNRPSNIQKRSIHSGHRSVLQHISSSRWHYSRAADLPNDKCELNLEDPMLRKYLTKLKTKYDTTKESSYKDIHKLQPTIDLINQIESSQQEMAELEEMVKSEAARKDGELAALAEEDIRALSTELKHLTQQLVPLLLQKKVQRLPPTAGRDVGLEISAGVGGQEAMLFAQDLWTMYQSYALSRRWKFEQQSMTHSDLGGLRAGSAVLSYPSGDIFSELCHEAGIHRVQRVPTTDRVDRIHTSTAAVVVMLQPSEIDIKIADKDLKVETMKSSGPGGQSVNTADSAVRITHLPSGLAVKCQTERKQHKNMANAMRLLRSQLYQRDLDREMQATNSSRRLQVGSRGRSEKIRTYNVPQDRVTDHRIGFTCHNLSGLLAGKEPFSRLLDRLQQVAAQETLQAVLESEP